MRKIKGIEMKGSKQLYTKLFFIYTSVIVSVVVALMVYFIGSTRSRYLENNKQYLGKMQDEIVEYMENCEGIANFLHGELYKSDMEMNDMVHYLQDSPEEYQKYRLDAYTAYQLGIYRGAEAYITGGFDAFESIKRVAVSYSKGDMTYFTEGQNVYHRADGTEILMRIRNNDLAGYGEFSFLKEIRDPNTLQSLGAMIVTFDTKRIQNIQEYYSKAEILVYNVSGTHIYDSDENRKPIVIENARQAGRLEEVLAAYVREDEVDQFRIIGYLDKKQAAKIPEERIAMIISMAVLVILIGVLMVNWYLMHLSTRLNHILDGMSQVMEGELSVRLEAEKNGDELDVISRHFNEMCEKAGSSY